VGDQRHGLEGGIFDAGLSSPRLTELRSTGAAVALGLALLLTPSLPPSHAYATRAPATGSNIAVTATRFAEMWRRAPTGEELSVPQVTSGAIVLAGILLAQTAS
jgi:hypothetical protein